MFIVKSADRSKKSDVRVITKWLICCMLTLILSIPLVSLPAFASEKSQAHNSNAVSSFDTSGDAAGVPGDGSSSDASSTTGDGSTGGSGTGGNGDGGGDSGTTDGGENSGESGGENGTADGGNSDSGNDTTTGTNDGSEGSEGDGSDTEEQTDTDAKDEAVDLEALDTIESIDGLYNIRIAQNSKVLGVYAASKKANAYIQIWTNSAAISQRFRIDKKSGFFTITNVNSNLVVGVEGGATKNGTNVGQYKAKNTKAQQWDIRDSGAGDGSVVFVSKLDPKLMLYVSAARNGTLLRVEKVSGSTIPQKYCFFLSPITPALSNGTYSINSTLSGSPALYVKGNSSANNTVVQLYRQSSSYGQKWQLAYNKKTGYYSIKGVGSNKSLEVAGKSTKVNAKAQIYTTKSSRAQKWAITENPAGSGSFEIRNANTGYALAVKGSKTTNGTQVRMEKRANKPSQRWTFAATQVLANGTYNAKSPLGTVLEIASGSRAERAKAQTYKANDTLRQKWSVTLVDSGFYRMECINSGLVLSVVSGTSTSVTQLAWTGANTQLWKPLPAGNSRFYLQNRATGTTLEISGASKANNAAVIVNKKKNIKAQHWSFAGTEILSNGKTYSIGSALDASKRLDIANASLDKGAFIQLNTSSSMASQQFTVTKVAKNTYTFKNRLSWHYLDLQSVAAVDNTPVWQNSSSSAASQRWRAEYAGGGTFKLVNMANQSVALALDGAAADGTPLVVRMLADHASQQFIFAQISQKNIVTLDGIDVSSWQPSNIGYLVDYDFMIVKATEGTTYSNPNLTAQASSALNRNKKLGLYHFASGLDAKAEARYFVSRAQPYIGRAILILDYEANALKRGREWVRTFMREVERLTNVKCGVYCSASPAAAQKIPQLCIQEGALFWNANYPLDTSKKTTTINGYRRNLTPMLRCDIFQYTSSGRLPGYGKNLDFNVYYGSSAEWDKWAKPKP